MEDIVKIQIWGIESIQIILFSWFSSDQIPRLSGDISFHIGSYFDILFLGDGGKTEVIFV
jgi:hypothetical protein